MSSGSRFSLSKEIFTKDSLVNIPHWTLNEESVAIPY